MIRPWVVVLEDCTASVNDEWQAFSIGQILPLIGEVATTSDLQEVLSVR